MQLFLDFKLGGSVLKYKKMMHLLRADGRKVAHLTHKCKLVGHISYYEMLTKLNSSCWKKKERDVKLFCLCCLIFQLNKDKYSNSSARGNLLKYYITYSKMSLQIFCHLFFEVKLNMNVPLPPLIC